MVRLNKYWSKDLAKKHFDRYPLWVWDDENEGYLPISDSKYTSEYGTLFIKSKFETNGHFFDGYLVGFDCFYAFGLFIADKEVGLNVNMPEFIEQSQNQIYELLKCNPFSLFPLRYKSPITFEDGDLITGLFEFKNGKLSCIPDNQEVREQKIRDKYNLS